MPLVRLSEDVIANTLNLKTGKEIIKHLIKKQHSIKQCSISLRAYAQLANIIGNYRTKQHRKIQLTTTYAFTEVEHN